MTALEHLKTLTAWESEPALTEEELEELLVTASLRDHEGNTPESEEWEPTYDINKAAAEAWQIKAARAASLVEVDPPGSGLFASKVFENCRAMARLYSSKRAACPSVSNENY